jgi:hypothetical protein
MSETVEREGRESLAARAVIGLPALGSPRSPSR